jgi:hypothetical protein
MILLRRTGGVCLAGFLLLSQIAVANPNSRAFTASADDVFRAAKKAAAGHRILIPQDEGLKDLTDSGQEIQSFQFATTLPGVTFRVIAEISVEPQPDGTTKLGIFFHRDRPYVPSSSLELREQQLQNQLESKIATLEQEKDKYETRYEVIHDIDLETYVAKQKEIHRKEYEAKLEEIEQERQAKIADLAGMPTSSFSTMDTAAEKFFKLVEQNLQGGKTKTAAGVNH